MVSSFNHTHPNLHPTQPKFGGIEAVLPITQKLFPTNVNNIIYLAQAAILGRFITGMARVLMDSRLLNPAQHTMRIEEVDQMTLERVFMELVGTLGFAGMLHFGQDLGGHVWQRVKSPEKFIANLHGVHDAEKNVLRAAFVEGLGCTLKDGKVNPNGMVERLIYRGNKFNLDKVLNYLDHNAPTLFQKTEKAFGQYTNQLNIGNSLLVFGTGIVLSVLFAGPVFQILNDKVIGPLAHRLALSWNHHKSPLSNQGGNKEYHSDMYHLWSSQPNAEVLGLGKNAAKSLPKHPANYLTLSPLSEMTQFQAGTQPQFSSQTPQITPTQNLPVAQLPPITVPALPPAANIPARFGGLRI